jgi:1-acyl-sn-glycerol-3-phosphate acyltransferase
MKICYQLIDFLTALSRLLWLGLHFALGITLLFVYRIRWGKRWFYTVQGAQSIQQWMRQGCGILGLKINVCGAASSRSAILVANHISWLDIVAIATATPVTFVSKLDLKAWPIVGVLAKYSGTVFIKRGSSFSMHETLTSLVDVLSLGCKTMFFPEGTTTVGAEVKKFHSGLFEAACLANCPVQPIAISYFRDAEADRDIAPYIDDDHFLTHLWRLLFRGKLLVQIDFLDEIKPNMQNRRGLAKASHSRISELITISAMINADYPCDYLNEDHSKMAEFGSDFDFLNFNGTIKDLIKL